MPKAKKTRKRAAPKTNLQRDPMLETAYHQYYYGVASKVEGTTGNDCFALWDCPRWLGTRCFQFPFDLIILQEIIWDCRPDFIIECGTALGGTTLFLASVCELIHHGTVISIDIAKNERPSHHGIMYVEGSTLDEAILRDLKELHDAKKRVMVILDSDHSKEHVLKELEAYSEIASLGQYMMIHDMNMHRMAPHLGPGPWEAVQQWNPNKHGFAVDTRRERLGGISYYEGGILLKVKE